MHPFAHVFCLLLSLGFVVVVVVLLSFLVITWEEGARWASVAPPIFFLLSVTVFLLQ